MSGDGSDTTTHDEDSARIGRRHFLAGSLAGVVGSALVRLPAAGAQVGDEFQPMLLGEENEAGGPTGLTYKGPGPTLQVTNLDSGPGIQVITSESPSIQGIGGGVIGTQQPITATKPIAGVQGLGNRVGVVGSTLPASATISPTITAGVWGTPSLAGSAPFSMTNLIGVAGTAFGSDQIGVVAHNPEGLALSVVGGVSVVGGITVNCGGTGLIAAGKREAEVLDNSIKAGSVVLATMTRDPGTKGATIQHVDTFEGYAVVSLTAPVRVDTTFSYLCFDLA